MQFQVHQSSLQSIEPLRRLFLQENNFQIRYNACHERQWSDSYVITSGATTIGYGAVKGMNQVTDRDAVFEFYVIPTFRKKATVFFSMLLQESKSRFIECQSNDFLLSAMMFEFGHDINSDVVLLKEHTTTALRNPGVIFRERKTDDIMFDHTTEPHGEYVLERDDEIIATGGFTLYYNMPFADLYMEVRRDHQHQGMGSYLVQELKRECYLKGRVPAARCNIDNIGSRFALIKAGLTVSGYMLTGKIRI